MKKTEKWDKEKFYDTCVNIYKETGQGPDKIMFKCFLKKKYLNKIMGWFDELIEEGLLLEPNNKENWGGFHSLKHSGYQTEQHEHKYLDYVRKFLGTQEDSPFYLEPSEEDYNKWLDEFNITDVTFSSTPYYKDLTCKPLN